MTLEAPDGKTVTLEKGVICAMRHIHMSPEDALKIGVKDRYIVRVKIQTDRELTFGDVLIRVHPNFRLAMHLDTDEGNAANVMPDSTGVIVGIESRG
jgi:acetate kinase